MTTTPGDVGTLLVGIGTLGTFVQSIRNHKVAKRVESTVGNANQAVKNVQASVGETNGVTLTELTKHIVSLVEYTHTRNHDIINGQSQTALALFAISRQLDQLIAKAGP